MEQLREQVMINQFVQVFKRVFITANNRKRRHPEKVVMLSVPEHFAKQSDVQHNSFQTLFSLFSILIVVHVLDNNCYDCCSGSRY